MIKHHDAGHDQLLGDKSGQGHVSGERAGDDADDDEPQRDFQPARLVPGQTLGDPRRRRLEAREKQRDEQGDVSEVRDEGLQNSERERHEERPRHFRERKIEGINAGDPLQQPANAPRTSIRQVEEAPMRLVYREHGGQQRADGDEEKKPLDQAGRKPIPRLIQQIECVEADIEQEACEQNGCGACRRCPGRGNRALDEGRRGLTRRPPRNTLNGILGNEIEKQRSSQQGADALLPLGGPARPVIAEITQPMADDRRFMSNAAPQVRQQRTGLAFEQIAGKEGVAHIRDAQDELARPNPGELCGLDGPVEGGCLHIEASPLGGDGGGFRRGILRGWRTELVDLVSDGRNARAELLRCLAGVVQDRLRHRCAAAPALPPTGSGAGWLSRPLRCLLSGGRWVPPLRKAGRSLLAHLVEQARAPERK